MPHIPTLHGLLPVHVCALPCFQLRCGTRAPTSPALAHLSRFLRHFYRCSGPPSLPSPPLLPRRPIRQALFSALGTPSVPPFSPCPCGSPAPLLDCATGFRSGRLCRDPLPLGPHTAVPALPRRRVHAAVP